MKKSLLAVAVAAALPTFAQAQTNVTLYGIIDAAAVLENNGDRSAFNIQGGVSSGNRWGLRGTEDLGGGMKGIFTLESGWQTDTGLSGQGGRLFGRQAFVGLEGGFGRVTLGRQYTPGFWVLANYDTIGLGMYGNTAGIVAPGPGGLPGGQVRWDNSIEYLTPSLGGFTARVMYSSDNDSTSPTPNNGEGFTAAQKKAGRSIGFGANYAAGPLGIGLGYHNWESDPVSADKNKALTVGGSWDFGAFKLYAGYFNLDPDGNNNKTTSVWLGGAIKIGGSGTLKLQGAQSKTDSAGSDPKGTTLALAYEHAMSRRTTLYANLGTVRNNETGNFSLISSSTVLAPSAAGKDPRAFALGVRHAF